MERNQIMVTARSTVFERIQGFKALTVGDMLMDTKGLESIIDLAEHDATVVSVLAKISKALVEAYQAYRNDRNFKAAFDRDEKVQYRKKQEDELTPGDMVTWINNNKHIERVDVKTQIPNKRCKP